MASLEDARRIACLLPGSSGEAEFGVQNGAKVRGFAWVWKERIDPKKPRVPNHSVLAIRTANVEERDALIASEPEKFFTEPHYNNFPALLARLANLDTGELEELLVEGWRCMAPRALVKAFDAGK